MKKSLDQIRCEKAYQRGIDAAKDKMKFAEWLKSQDVTAKEIATATDKSLVSVYRWQGGIIPPAVDLVKIAHFISKKTDVDSGLILVEIFETLEEK